MLHATLKNRAGVASFRDPAPPHLVFYVALCCKNGATCCIERATCCTAGPSPLSIATSAIRARIDGCNNRESRASGHIASRENRYICIVSSGWPFVKRLDGWEGGEATDWHCGALPLPCAFSVPLLASAVPGLASESPARSLSVSLGKLAAKLVVQSLLRESTAEGSSGTHKSARQGLTPVGFTSRIEVYRCLVVRTGCERTLDASGTEFISVFDRILALHCADTTDTTGNIATLCLVYRAAMNRA